MILLESHIVPLQTLEARLSDYARVAFPQLYSRNAAKKAIKTGAIRVNGQQAETGTWVQPGMKLDWYDLLPTPPKPYDLPLQVIHEDDHLAVVLKPAGLRISGPQYKTLLNALPGNLSVSTASDALRWPRPVHRLDQATQGLVLIAKSRLAQVRFTQMFEAREIEKEYTALVTGLPPKSGQFTAPLEGKEALSLFERVQQVPSIKNEWVSRVRLFPKTGRTHQLRLHLSKAGYPILGDPLYSQEGMQLRGKGLFLAAVKLQFVHPHTDQPVTYEIPIPPKFLKRMEREEQMWQKKQANQD